MSYAAFSVIDGSSSNRSTSGENRIMPRRPLDRDSGRARQQHRVGEPAAAGVAGDKRPLAPGAHVDERGEHRVGVPRPRPGRELGREAIVGDEHRAAAAADRR